jgi:hypothetical protein
VLLTSLIYENFELYNPTISLEMIVWSMCGGLAIGTVATFINRRVVGEFVRRLVKNGIHTPEAAITLAQSGCSRNLFVRRALRTGKSLRRVVACANEDEMPVKTPSASKAAVLLRRIFSVEAEPEQIVDLTRARFYVPEELRIRAELRYEINGTTVPNLVLSLLLIVAGGFAALYLVPELLTFLDNFLTIIRA